jgi:hypothetical protein
MCWIKTSRVAVGLYALYAVWRGQKRPALVQWEVRTHWTPVKKPGYFPRPETFPPGVWPSP